MPFPSARPGATTAPALPVAASPPSLPSAEDAVAHTLLNCLHREVSGPERRTAVEAATGRSADAGHLRLRLARSGTVLRVRLRRTSLLGDHRFLGPVAERSGHAWHELTWQDLAERVHTELGLRTGVDNDEFLGQLAASHAGVAAGLGRRAPAPASRYLESEQALVFGHRFHPTPKARSGDLATWAAYAPEARATFRLRHLAVRSELVAQDRVSPAATAVLDRLRRVPDGYTLLPAHPWQYELLRDDPRLRAALARGDVLDLGEGGAHFTPTASVRTLSGAGAFLKFSLNVRITNCIRKNAAYELSGAVALTRALAPILGRLARRFPGHAVLGEPAYRSVSAAVAPDLLEGFGVIVREGLDAHVRPGATPLLAAAVADEYPTGAAHISRLLDGGGPRDALRWWDAYLRLLVPPVLSAYLDHGVVLEPHLQNVLVAVDDDGLPSRVLLRDMEGTKLLPEPHAATLAALPTSVAEPMTYGARRGWDRVTYCLLVNNVAEVLAALTDLHPRLEAHLWARVRAVLEGCRAEHGDRAPLRALLDGAPLPAKANLLARWERRADREAEYVRIPSPLARSVLGGALRTRVRRSS
ncbi:IucA/IucC family protein [Streptomyces sp. SID3343]|uniref:IucA/IucC family protein n=1 Tax=Streptomyces sp. SID3343 TaxID=2690260 RepID=UPI00136ACF4E|nr:IucA/IucC family protein [Streptomyces sp. SID3343]MYW05892.1 iron transporter [Streptomyces sp. SID3343]